MLFVRGNAKISEVTLNHEKIHTAQMKEMLYVFFYLWYIFEWLIRLFMKGNAYRNISFEREAYSNEDDVIYLDSRKIFAWTKYLNKIKQTKLMTTKLIKETIERTLNEAQEEVDNTVSIEFKVLDENENQVGSAVISNTELISVCTAEFDIEEWELRVNSFLNDKENE